MLEWVALGAAGAWWYRRRGKEREREADAQAPAQAAPPAYKDGVPAGYQPPAYDGGQHNYGASQQNFGGNQNDGGYVASPYVAAPGPQRKKP